MRTILVQGTCCTGMGSACQMRIPPVAPVRHTGELEREPAGMIRPTGMAWGGLIGETGQPSNPSDPPALGVSFLTLGVSSEQGACPLPSATHVKNPAGAPLIKTVGKIERASGKYPTHVSDMHGPV